jgi:hypothetical protein
MKMILPFQVVLPDDDLYAAGCGELGVVEVNIGKKILGDINRRFARLDHERADEIADELILSLMVARARGLCTDCRRSYLDEMLAQVADVLGEIEPGDDNDAHGDFETVGSVQ